ncbi:MAG TPA: hypothetical protein VHE78_01400 [Gemmatimonadaceae bacterium]|nr:hypothetical protein [Gemmatimonadaceae bacterium]
MPILSRTLAVSIGSLAIIAMAPAPSLDLRPARPAPEASVHDFDFMLGSWTFIAESKNPSWPPRFNGYWTGVRSGHGTIIEDDYRLVNDSGKVVTWRGHAYQPDETIFIGVTYRAFDPLTKRWTTAFVQPPAAGWALGTAWREGDAMWEAPSDSARSSRAHFYNIEANHFSWSLEVSKDGGKTWVADFLRVDARRVGGAADSRTPPSY